jgi:hypothetical protein
MMMGEAVSRGFFPSIRATLATSDHRLVLRRQPRRRLPRTQSVGRSDAVWHSCLHREQAAVDRHLIAVCEALAEASLSSEVYVNHGDIRKSASDPERSRLSTGAQTAIEMAHHEQGPRAGRNNSGWRTTSMRHAPVRGK